MIAQDGLASVACDTRVARVLAGVAGVMNFLACYLVLTEVGEIISLLSKDTSNPL
jgi:hypothetical protein